MVPRESAWVSARDWIAADVLVQVHAVGVLSGGGEGGEDGLGLGVHGQGGGQHQRLVIGVALEEAAGCGVVLTGADVVRACRRITPQALEQVPEFAGKPAT